MFQYILGIKRFEHQLFNQGCQVQYTHTESDFLEDTRLIVDDLHSRRRLVLLISPHPYNEFIIARKWRRAGGRNSS